MELRDFSVRNAGVPALICAPFALHYPTVADFAPADWRSARCGFSRSTIIWPISMSQSMTWDIGLCQGGVMAAVYAARFPHKVRRLVLAGAPIDISAGDS